MDGHDGRSLLANAFVRATKFHPRRVWTCSDGRRVSITRCSFLHRRQSVEAVESPDAADISQGVNDRR